MIKGLEDYLDDIIQLLLIIINYKNHYPD